MAGVRQKKHEKLDEANLDKVIEEAQKDVKASSAPNHPFLVPLKQFSEFKEKEDDPDLDWCNYSITPWM